MVIVGPRQTTFAFVEFEHLDAAESAVRHLDGRDLNGERVHVEFAKGPPRGRDGNTGGRGGNNMSSFGRRDGPMRRDGPTGGNGGGSGGSSSGRRDFKSDRGRDRDDSNRTGGGISYAEKYGPPRNTDFRIIVENLSTRVSWQDLKDLMRQAGEVTFADAHKRERNMGIVDFASMKDMRHAVEKFDDTEFMGRRIKVYEDRSRSRRSNGGSGGDGGRRSGRSRSRSRGYSNSRSRSRDRLAGSRSRSRSPIRRDSPRVGRGSRSPVRREPQRSRSRSRSRSRESSLSDRRQSRSRSRSPVARERDAPSRSRSASGSPPRRPPVRSEPRSRSRSRSAGSSHSEKKQSRSRSRSPVNDRDRSGSRSRSASNRGSSVENEVQK